MAAAERSTGTTVRISDSYHRVLRELSEQEHTCMQTVLERAIEDYRRRHFLDELNNSFANLRGQELEDERTERDEWNVTTNDGIATD